MPTRPDILHHQPGRVWDNWKPLLAIADHAGGQWPQLTLDAIAQAVSVERRLTMVQRLLISIRTAFDTMTESIDFTTNKRVVVGPFDRLATAALIDTLLADPDEEWATANRGRPISSYWLRDHLRGLLDPPKAQDWEQDGKHHSGYLKLQFEKAWEAHLADVDGDKTTTTHTNTHPPSGGSGLSGGSEQNQQDDQVGFANGEDRSGGGNPFSDPSNEPAAPVSPPDPPDQQPDAAAKTSTISTVPPDPPDPPDAPGRVAGIVGQNGPVPSIAEQARRLREHNPGWPVKRIAKELAQPESRVAKLLNEPSVVEQSIGK